MPLPAGKRQIEAGPGVIGVADMTSNPGFCSALLDRSREGRRRLAIQRDEVAPHGRGLTHISANTAVHQEITDVWKIVLGRLERFPGTRAQVDRAEAAVDGADLTMLANDVGLAPLKRREH